VQFSEFPKSDHPLVTLRALSPEDIGTWFGYLSMPAVFEHTSWNVKSPDDLAHYTNASESGSPSTLFRVVIADRATNKLVGTMGFHTVSPDHRSAEIAYDLSPGAWGKGIASHTARIMLDWAHSHVGVVRVQATTLESNVRSMKVLDRAGFEREGLLRSFRFVRGRPGNFWMYSHVRAAN
jgi:[ribosomal protein S5]-alanine N-acetyltransferase